MYDLEKANKIYDEQLSKDSHFDHNLVIEWRDNMPYEFAKKMYEIEYGKHIWCEEMYKDGLSYITDNKGNEIELWNIKDIKEIASEYIDIDDEKFYSYDLYLWANVKKADLKGIEDSASKIIKYAISDLQDKDFPFYPADEKAYRWVEAHEKEKY